MRMAFVLVPILAASAFVAGEGPPGREEVVSGGASPSGKILIEYSCSAPHRSAEVTKHIWLASASDPSKRKLLFTHWRSARVVFSPDEEWIAVNDQSGSSESSVILFRRRKGIDYERVEDAGHSAWDFWLKRMGRQRPLPFDHAYSEALRWTDERTLLLCLWGHLDSKNYLEDWLCLYDITSKRFTPDLERHNQRHLMEGK